MGVQINGDTGNISATKADYSGNVTIGGTLTYEDVTNIDSVGLITARNGIEVGARPGVGASISVDGNAEFAGIVTATQFKGDGSQLSNITSTTINSNADNRLITGSGTANTLNGESGATYDGTDFTISSGVLKLTDESNGQQLRIGAAGDFYIEHDGSNTYIKNTTGDTIIQNDANVKITASSGGTERFKVDSSGNATVSNGNLVIGTSGKGIDFSAASGSASGSTSALLDDYEEGTYDARVVNGMDPDISSNDSAYQYKRGYYRKIGTLVEFNFYIQITNNSSYEGDGAHVKFNLPFTQDYANQKRGHGLLTYHTMNGINVGANGIHIYVYDSKAELYSGSTQVAMGNGDSQADRYIIGGGHFHTT